MNEKCTGQLRHALAICVVLAAGWTTSCLCADDAKEAVKKQLHEAKVSFEFVDKPFADAVKFISDATKVAITIDPEVLKNSPPKVNLKITDMNADMALEWIVKLSEVEYSIGEKGVNVSKPKK